MANLQIDGYIPLIVRRLYFCKSLAINNIKGSILQNNKGT